MSNPSPAASLSSLSRNDKLFLGGSLLALICTFLPFDGISFEGFSASENAWHGIGVLAALLVFVAFVVAIVAAFASSSVPTLPVSLDMIGAGASGLALLFFLLHWVTLPGGHTVVGIHSPGLSLHWGGYITIIVVLALTAFEVMRVLASGEPMPWQQGSTAMPPPEAPPTV
jgi:hypothetical protein